MYRKKKGAVKRASYSLVFVLVHKLVILPKFISLQYTCRCRGTLYLKIYKSNLNRIFSKTQFDTNIKKKIKKKRMGILAGGEI